MISSGQTLPRCLLTYIARRNRMPSRILPRWMIVLALAQQVALVQRPLDQAVERRFVRGVQQQAADRPRS